MANIKSAKKRVKVIATKTLQRQSCVSAIKTYIKKFEAAVESGDLETAKAALNLVNKKLDQAASKKALEANMVSRKKSQLAKKMNAMGA